MPEETNIDQIEGEFFSEKPASVEQEEVQSLVAVAPESILRIEREWQFLWTGVAHCDSDERYESEWRQQLNAWVEARKLEYPGYRVLRYSHTGGTLHTRWHRPIGGARSCLSKMTTICWVEFLIP